jgi:hypothetical protein
MTDLDILVIEVALFGTIGCLLLCCIIVVQFGVAKGLSCALGAALRDIGLKGAGATRPQAGGGHD